MAPIVTAAVSALAVLLVTPPEEVKAEQKKEKKICETYPPPIGTRLGVRKVCLTKAEWDQMDIIRAEGRRNVERIQQVRQCRLNDCR